jgi:hypothetical protein
VAAARARGGGAPPAAAPPLLAPPPPPPHGRCSCLLPALSAHTTAHTYHGGGGGGGGGESDEDARSEELRRVRSLRNAAAGGAGGAAPGAAREPSAPGPHLPEVAARAAMLDPLAALMASRGMPLGINLRLDAAARGRLPPELEEAAAEAAAAAEAEAEAAAAARVAADARPPPRQLLGRRRRGSGAAAAATEGTDLSAHVAARLGANPARALEQLEHLLASASTGGGGGGDGGDSWGTTTQSAAEIARRIAESNRGAWGIERAARCRVAAQQGPCGPRLGLLLAGCINRAHAGGPPARFSRPAPFAAADEAAGGGGGGGGGDGESSDDEEGAAGEDAGPFLTPEQVGPRRWGCCWPAAWAVSCSAGSSGPRQRRSVRAPVASIAPPNPAPLTPHRPQVGRDLKELDEVFAVLAQVRWAGPNAPGRAMQKGGASAASSAQPRAPCPPQPGPARPRPKLQAKHSAHPRARPHAAAAAAAQVPWLDGGNVEERELRGVVAVGLLGTLEEVGWDLREGVAAIWGGARDGDALAKDALASGDARRAAALSAVLYHTRKLEDEYGPPPPEGAAAAAAAARAGGEAAPRQQREEQAAQQQRADEAAGRRKPGGAW